MSSATVVNSQTLSVAKGSNLTRAMSNGAAATPRTLDLSRGEPDSPANALADNLPTASKSLIKDYGTIDAPTSTAAKRWSRRAGSQTTTPSTTAMSISSREEPRPASHR